MQVRTKCIELAEGLKAVLDALTACDQWFIRHNVPRPLYSSGVVYGRTDLWETIPSLYAASYHGTDREDSTFRPRFGRFGDSKSLTAARVAELRERGLAAEPVLRFPRRPGGPDPFHALVKWRDSQGEHLEDPSARLGMGRDELSYFE